MHYDASLITLCSNRMLDNIFSYIKVATAKGLTTSAPCVQMLFQLMTTILHLFVTYLWLIIAGKRTLVFLSRHFDVLQMEAWWQQGTQYLQFKWEMH